MCSNKFVVKHLSLTQDIMHIFELIRKKSITNRCGLKSKKVVVRAQIFNNKLKMKFMSETIKRHVVANNKNVVNIKK
jgi:C4-type Zn-finger protein